MPPERPTGPNPANEPHRLPHMYRVLRTVEWEEMVEAHSDEEAEAIAQGIVTPSPDSKRSTDNTVVLDDLGEVEKPEN